MLNNCAGAILSGGKSSRMGVDKANLIFRGKSFLQHAEELLKEAGINKIYISHQDSIPDKILDRGPLGGIHAILEHILNNSLARRYEHIIFVPVDMPLLTPLLINKLMKSAVDIKLVKFKGYKMPFRLRVDNQALESAKNLLSSGKNFSIGAFQDMVNSLKKLEVAQNESSHFDNINTPEDWDILSKKR